MWTAPDDFVCPWWLTIWPLEKMTPPPFWKSWKSEEKKIQILVAVCRECHLVFSIWKKSEKNQRRKIYKSWWCCCVQREIECVFHFFQHLKKMKKSERKKQMLMLLCAEREAAKRKTIQANLATWGLLNPVLLTEEEILIFGISVFWWY